MPKERCEQQAALALASLAATNRVYDAKNALDAAKRQKLDTESYELALYDAREAEWQAIAELEGHKKQHKCWPSGCRDQLLSRPRTFPSSIVGFNVQHRR
jgi:hypothetical protein